MRGYTLTNVLGPADAQDVATKQYVDGANKAFVFGDGRYMAAADVSMEGRRINNVGMPIENHQASNKFYVDTVLQSANASDKALTKILHGSFASTGEIYMSGNSIYRDAAANTNYVDNGGAIAKNPDGKLTAVSHIDFNGFSLKNIPDPTDRKNAANKAYVDSIVSLPSFIGTKPVITVWAEEKGPLGDGHYEFSFGNGSSGSEHAYGDYCMRAPSRNIPRSVTVTESKVILSEDVKVNIVVNGIEQVNHSIVKKSKDICSCTIFPDPIELNQCNVINFISRTANNKITNAYVSILIELDL